MKPLLIRWALIVVAVVLVGCTMNIEGALRRQGVSMHVLGPAELIAESLGLLEREMVA